MTTNINYFKIKHKNTVLKQGSILIAEPFSSDTYFKRSVILITHIDKDGAFGFVLNKYVDVSLKDIIGKKTEFEANISIGGPVSDNRIDFVHTLGNKIPNSKKIIESIYWGGDFEVLFDLIKNGLIKEHEVNFFIGYAGWGKEQLDNEIKNNYWIVADVDTKTIMQFDENYWQNTIKRLGSDFKSWLNLPEDPQLN